MYGAIQDQVQQASAVQFPFHFPFQLPVYKKAYQILTQYEFVSKGIDPSSLKLFIIYSIIRN